METNDIKSIWKEGIAEGYVPYSNSELNELVVKSARKSIKSVYPGTILKLVIIGVILFLIVMLLWGSRSKEEMIVHFSALIILSVSYFISKLSVYRMLKYSYGMPVKEWLEYRKNAIEKSIRFRKKYFLLVYACSLLFALGFYISYQIAFKITLGLLTVFLAPIGIVIYLWIVQSFQNRKYKETLNELRKLCNQFDESQ